MKQKYIIIIGIVLLLVVVFFVYSSSLDNESKSDVIEKKQEASNVVQKISQPQIRYFNPSDKIIISADENILYTDKPTTKLSYYALDNSGQLVHFKEGDRAFVRILGIKQLYTQNAEITHPKNADGTIDDTLFYGNITINETGKYLIKVCMGKSINLDDEGNIVWPFGCYEEDTASDVVDVFKR